jgi:succinate-acetate transporter protein
MTEERGEVRLNEHPWALIGRRLSRPFKQWTFWFVMIVGILGLGYLAVWIEEGNLPAAAAGEKLEPLRLAYSTAMIAVAAPCIAQLVLALNKMAGLTALLLTVIISALAFRVSAATPNLSAIHWHGVPGLLVALFAWWLANGEDELFQDRTMPNVSTGGTDTQRDLPGGQNKVKT